MMELKQEGERVVQIQHAYEDHLVVGSIHSLWDYLLFPLVKNFRELHPLISLRLITDHSPEIVAKMLDGIIDMGIVYIPPHHPEMEVIPLFQDSFQLVGAVDFFTDPKSGEPLTHQDLQTLSYVHHDWGPPFTDWYQQEFRDFPLSALTVNHISLLVQCVLGCKSLGFLPETIAKPLIQAGKIKMIPFYSEIPMPKRSLYLVYPKRKKTDFGVQRFVNQILSYSFHEPVEPT
ncbi:substrate-binding domain-containing protein [Brevibacillus sp. NRS-1366]|uniref:substrate-binding domain-containing protein n=1 Tax=Brevibacillus sp. NRS-1366 TaxID=3233899 RepID=UPI003D1C7598